MWRRVYLALLLVRLYFALSPSYLHPDENFQGPEVIAGQVFPYPVHHTWEFTTEHPIRSTFPLWLAYGLPMTILKWLWQGLRKDEVPPAVVYWTLRVLMFVLSFVLEDWAIQELVQSVRQRRIAVLLVASSYVTWTYQTHTFSNALETIIVLWTLVLMARIVENKGRSGAFACGILAFLVVLGTFNRITFPAYIMLPGLQLVPHFQRKPLALLGLLFFGTLTTALGIFLDTAFYHPEAITFRSLWEAPVITPLNNFLYNTSTSNLAHHGLHPYYQHLVANLPQLLGPVYPLLFLGYCHRSVILVSAMSGVLLLSIFPHQEARFLIPAVPLVMSSIKLPTRYLRPWVTIWVAFNLVFAVLMGIYHQGGVVPMQIHIGAQPDVSHVLWWKTYSPPIWLLDGKNENTTTTDLLSVSGLQMVKAVSNATGCVSGKSAEDVYLVAPASATFLDVFSTNGTTHEFVLEERWRYSRHLNLDDLDFGEDGIWSTLSRVIGRRGLVLWNVKRRCSKQHSFYF